jgi:hypothetical protein
VRTTVLLATLAVAGCRAPADHASKTPAAAIAWHQLGAWAGRSSVQTESFTSDTGALRIRWETASPSGTASDPAGTFRLTAHSAISGRPLQQVVDQSGAGTGTGYVQQDPHVFYLVVEADQVNWKFTVEEAIAY